MNEELKFCENSKNIYIYIFFFGGGGWLSGWLGRVVSGWGVRVDMNEELKFLGKFTKKNRGGSGGVVRWGSGW